MSSFGRYEILEKLGAGGMAEVYLARAYGADGFVKDLVLKKVLATRAEDTQFRQMFVDEAKITVSLTHTNIVQVFDFGKVDDTYFLAMERVHGCDLRRVLGRLEDTGQRLPVPLALYVVSEILKGLDYAHRRNGPDGRHLKIVHRDVSPSNVLLSYEGEVKIADFGIARVAETDDSGSTTVIGKPRYMAPEQIRGETVDARADVFGCGVVLAEMLLGEQPFATANDMDTFAMVLTGTTVKPLDASAGIPPDLIPMVRKAMSTDPGNRFASAGAFLKQIEDYALDRKIRLSGSALASLLRDLIPQEVAMARPDPGPTRDQPTIFERVAAGPGEVAHFTANFDGGGASTVPTGPQEAKSRVRTARVDVSIPVTPRRSRAPVVVGSIAGLAFVGFLAQQSGMFAGADFVMPVPTQTAVTRASEIPTATAVPSATPDESPWATPTRFAMRPTPRRTVSAATPTPAIAIQHTPVPTPVVAAAPGTLVLNAIPWGEVSIGGKVIGTTPIRGYALAPGTYDVAIRHPPTGVSAKLTVTIESGKETRHPGVTLK